MPLGEDQWRKHAELIGRVMLAWNRNVHQLARIFCFITGIDSPMAEAIFFSHQSDAGQRNLIKRSARAAALPKDDFEKLSTLLKSIETISVRRNLAAHTIFGMSLFDEATGAWGLKVVPALRPSQDPRLDADFTNQFEGAERELAEAYEAFEEWLRHARSPQRPWLHTGAGYPKAVGGHTPPEPTR